MFVIPAILLFLVAIYVRPHELFAPLSGLPLLYVGVGCALIGLAIDLRIRAARAIIAPPILQALCFLIWLVIATALANRVGLASRMPSLALLLALLVTVAIGVQSFRMLHLITGVLLIFGLFISLVMIAQRFGPITCIQKDDTPLGYSIPGIGCTDPGDSDPCDLAGDPTEEYRCVRIGPLNIASIDARARYMGVLQDPNEVSMVLCCFIPFAIALYQFKKTLGRLVLLIAVVLLYGTATVFSQSRGGLLVMMSIAFTYFVISYGYRGIVLGALLALPMMALKGSRSEAESASSSEERLSLWYLGMNLARAAPVTGVGYMHFEDFSFLTAHNTWILTVAELGLPGLFLFILILQTCFRIFLAGYFRYKDRPEAKIAFVWSKAMLSSLVGTVVGITFLSFTYKTVLWIQIGIYGAVFSCISAHDPDFKVKTRLRDLVVAAVATAAVFMIFYIVTRLNPSKQ